MPQGEGTYGSQVGRPPEKKKSKAAKYAARMEKKGKQIKVDKLARKQRTDEARERFKGGQIIKKLKFKKKRKEDYKKAWEEGSWQD